MQTDCALYCINIKWLFVETISITFCDGFQNWIDPAEQNLQDTRIAHTITAITIRVDYALIITRIRKERQHLFK